MAAHDPMLPLAAAVLHLGIEPERALLVDSGDGDGVLFLAREFPHARVRGVDASAQATAQATARVGLDPEGRVAFRVGGPRALPFPDDHFDLLVGAPGRPPARECGRVLRPGGRLVLIEPQARSAPARLLRRWRAVGTSRGGFDQLAQGRAGDGIFCVMALREPVNAPASD